MMKEQQRTIDAFRNNHSKDEKIVIYGTGINAEAVIKNCSDFQIVGLMDAARTGDELWGLKVLSEEQIVAMGAKTIVIVARPAVHSIIYKRIERFVKQYHISVYDIFGNDVSKKKNVNVKNSGYFNVSYDDLLGEIKNHQVISFDIFDTLLCRRVYQPQDVFHLMKTEDIWNGFPEMRENAEKKLEKEPTIYLIYDYIRENSHISDEDAKELLKREIQKEKQVLYARKRMVECFQQCIQMGKEVYLVSDMYMPKPILEEILQANRIVGYKEILVSCEHKVSKAEGLFDVLKSHIGNNSCLHIGDNHERDFIAAKKAGLDAFEIMSPIKMMEISTYQFWLSYTNSLGNRTMLGMLASTIFNDPFILYKSQGKPVVDSNYYFGYSYIAPLLVAVISWLIYNLQGEKDAIILFAARDGFLFQKAYHVVIEKLELKQLPEDLYFLISRNAIAQVIDKEAYQDKKEGYVNYIAENGILDKSKIYFFDFMSKGTCQLGLQKLLGGKIEGMYVQRSLCDHKELNELLVQAFYEETSAMQKDRRIFAMCDFLECIFTSFSPSLKEINKIGKPVYEEEIRKDEQLRVVDEIQTAMIEFVNDYFKVYQNLPIKSLNVDFVDDILQTTQSSFTRINLPDIEEINLDDAGGECKNTGRDIL